MKKCITVEQFHNNNNNNNFNTLISVFFTKLKSTLVLLQREVRTESEGGEFVGQEINNNAPRQHICRCILNLWKMSWFRFLFRCTTKMNYETNRTKQN